MDLTSFDMFAGAGGLALGAKLAGFKHIAVADWNRNAIATLNFNKQNGLLAKDWEVIDGDMRNCDYSRFCESVDFVFAGPPCQPFSLGGNHKANKDSRDMFPEVVRAVRAIRPIGFVIENVKGILRPGFSDYLQYVELQLSFPYVEKGEKESWSAHLSRLRKAEFSSRRKAKEYRVAKQVLNAADFGVAQKRERVFFVGLRSDLATEYEFPVPTHFENALLYSQWVDGRYWEEHRIPKKKRPETPLRFLKRIERISSMTELEHLPRWQTVRDALKGLPKLAEGQTSKLIANHFLNPGARIYPGHDGSPLDLPAKTLKAGDHGVPGGENMIRFHDGRVRYFSIRECARLQTFPDNWVIEGSWTEGMRQLGNAVPVQLGRVVAEQLKASVTNQSEKETVSLRKSATRPLNSKQKV